MRRVFFPPCAVLPVFLLSILAGTAGAQSIKLDPTFIELGNMQQMETRTVTVKVSNVGAGLLVIEEIRADCGCTVPDMKVKSIKPGETTDMTVVFDSKQFSGPQHKLIYITSNDPDRRKLELAVTATVKAILTVDPQSERLGFARSLAGDTPTRRAVFTAPDVKLKITASRSQKGLFDVKVVNGVDGDPHVSALDVTLPATMEPGQHVDVVQVGTNVPERPSVDIELRCWVARELEIWPEEVNLRFQPSFNESVRITASNAPLDFKVTKVEIDLPEIKLQIVETVPRQTTNIKLTGIPVTKTDPRAIAGAGRITGTLKIYTDRPKSPVIEVPVSYMVRM